MISTLDLLLQFGVFTAVFAGALALERAVWGVVAVRRRLNRETTTAQPVTPRASVLQANTVTNRALQWVQSATSLSDAKESSKLRRELALAGFDHPAAPVWYVIIRFSLAIGLPLSAIVLPALAGKPLTGGMAVFLPLIECASGLFAPRWFVSRRASNRRIQIAQEFPDALDLMVVCVEAGLGLEAAFVRVGQEVRESHPRIAEEFGRLADELSAGRGRADALRALAERVDVDSIRSFVALLIQTDTLGVSIAQSLRTYSAEMRETRFLVAEEKAMRIPLLMTVPIVTCLMPVIVVALLLPPVIDVIRVLMPTIGAGPTGAP